MMSLTHRLLTSIFCIASLVSCNALTGKEVGRATFTEVVDPGNLKYQKTLLKLSKGEKIQFWTEMDLDYDDPLNLKFYVQLPKTMGIAPLDLYPLQTDITIGERKTVVGNHVSWSFSGRIGSFEAPVTGDYNFGTLLFSDGNPTLQLKKAVLVFKK